MEYELRGMGLELGSYVNKMVDFKFCGAELRFELSQALFSSFDVDTGTRLLLRTVARDPVLASARRVLDEGCGVGVIGLCVAKAFPEAELVLRDRDSLAAAFAERNRLTNKLRGTTAWKDPATGGERLARPAPRIEWGLLGDGLENGPYDFVLSNLPAKAGAPVLASFFARLSGRSGGAPLLAPGGRSGVVVVKPLAEATEAWIAEAGLSVVARARGSGHNVFVVEAASAAQRTEASAPSAEAPPAAYLRGQSRFKLGELSYRAEGFYGLPEFDTPSYGSSVAAELGGRACSGALVRDALFIEPGVGHLPIWAARVLGASRVVAASRDELSLKAVAHNLASLPAGSRPAYEAVDALGAAALPPASFDLVAESPEVMPELDWTSRSWALASRLLKRGGTYLAYCSPTEMARLEKRRPAGSGPDGGAWSLLGQKRKKGFVSSAWRKE